MAKRTAAHRERQAGRRRSLPTTCSPPRYGSGCSTTSVPARTTKSRPGSSGRALEPAPTSDVVDVER